MAKTCPFASCQEPVDYLSLDQRREYQLLAWLIGNPDKSDDRIKQIRIDRINAYCLNAGVALPALNTGFHHDRGDDGRVEIQSQAEIGHLLGRPLHTEDNGEVDSE